MTVTVFFSWQLDTPVESGLKLIEGALKAALQRIVDDSSVERAVREEGIEVDRDTLGIPGTPPIVDTIFTKIDRAAIFVPDLTFTARRQDGRPSPNPNVLIEYGWALKSLTHARILPVMNAHYGVPTAANMPFDMRHLRFPIQFKLSPEAPATETEMVQASLSRELEGAIRAIIESSTFAASLPKPPPFPAAEAKEGKSRFRAKGMPLGMTYPHFIEASREVYLAGGASMWIRLMPLANPLRSWSTAELKQAATRPGKMLIPLAAIGSVGSLSYLRADDGFGIFCADPSNEPTPSVAFVFHTGEIWSIDAFHLGGDNAIPVEVHFFSEALRQYTEFLRDGLGLNPPYKCVLGIDGVKGRPVWLPAKSGRMFLKNPFGSCVTDVVEVPLIHKPESQPIDTLRPFFATVLDKCGFDDSSILDGG